MTKARDNANGGLGLILIKPSSVVNGTDNGKGTVSFSAASSVSLNNVFSSTYDFYRITIQTVISSANNLVFRLRVAGSDNSTASSYTTQVIRGSSTTASALRFQENYGELYSADSDKSVCTLDIVDPFAVGTTAWTGIGGRTDRTNGFMGFHNQSTSYDGFTFYPLGSTISGKISVYGYNK